MLPWALLLPQCVPRMSVITWVKGKRKLFKTDVLLKPISLGFLLYGSEDKSDTACCSYDILVTVRVFANQNEPKYEERVGSW